MNSHQSHRSHVLACLIVVGCLYVTARVAGWTGPGSRLELDRSILVPGIVVVTGWGLLRLARRKSCD